MNKLYNMNCMKYMARCKDNQFDLAIVDPPYGIKPVSNFGVKETIKFDKKDVEWDIKPNQIYFDELFRISKNQIICGGNYFKLNGTRCFLIWDKKNGNNPFADCEYAWTSFKTSARIFRYFWLGSHIHKKENIIHPTQKPVALYKWLLTNYAKPGDKLIDTHSGSGSFRIAAYDLGFDLVSCELDKDYFNDNENRFQNHISQKDLFSTEEYQDLIYE